MNNLVFIPIGSYEQHGPHLPPETDYLIAKRVVDIIASKFEGIILDGIKIGISPEHKGFPTTKTISKTKFKIQIKRLIKKYNTDAYFILINAHGGNNQTLNSIQRKNKNHILIFNTFSIMRKEIFMLRTSKIGGICHAGEFETSLMMYLFPEMVKMENLRENDITYVSELDPNYKKKTLNHWKTLNFSKSGILGDPYHANRKKGELWFKFLITKLQNKIIIFLNK